jgi:glycosyltransferase involved in cell wall biosynthesis
MLCELTPIKRVYDMILTVYELKKQGHHFVLHVGGAPKDGSNNARYFVSIKRAVEKLGLQDQVVFHGWVDDPASWLQQIEIFVSNSYWEGQQNALLEAMATGCYCLSHFWDGAEEILPQEYLFASDTELQHRIINYCNLPDEERHRHQNRLSSIARQKFDVEQMKLEIRDIIQEVALENGVPR